MSLNQTESRRSVSQCINREGESQEANLREGGSVGDLDWSNKEGVVRIAMQNIQGLGFDKRERKYKLIYNFIRQYEVDLIGMVETNTFWPKVQMKKSIYERTKEWFEARYLNVGYNERDKDPPRSQHGGVINMTMDKLTHKVVESGGDPRKLGRWSWVRFRGKNNRHLRVATIYRPCVPVTSTNITKGAHTVHCQHVRALLKDNVPGQPRRIMMDDLHEEVVKWKEEGDSIIVMGDFNEDVRNDYCKQWRDNLGLKDVVLERLGENLMPATHIRGSEPIDSIWTTANIEVKRTIVMSQDEGAGDHRPIMIDIRAESVFGFNIPNTPTMRARKLKHQDPRIVKKYLSILGKFYTRHDFYQMIYGLSEETIEYPLQKSLQTRFEKLDRIRVAGMKHAESKCRKFYCGRVPWSPDIGKAHNVIELWTLIVRRLEGRKVHATTINRKKRECMFEGDTMVGVIQARKLLQEAYSLYSMEVKNSAKNRATFLEDLAMAKAREGNTKAGVELNKMRRMEKTRESWRRIHRMDGTARKSGGLNRIISPNANGEWSEKVSKEEVEQGTLEENERRFTQAKGTPMTTSPLKDDLGLVGDGIQAVNLLKGQYTCNSSVETSVDNILSHLQTKKDEDIIEQPVPITQFELNEGWRRVKERTSSSPSGLHVGHWKAACKDPALLWVNTVMLNVPYRSGYSPKRWQQGINVMLEKIPGNCRVDKLRTILLYEADFNIMNKYIGQSMMSYAEKSGLIARVQYGGRKRHAANDHALNKRLIFDILRQKRKRGAICSCDLKSCYDRVVHAFAALSMRRAGVAETATVSMFNTIQKLVHRVRTAFGDSEESFGGELWRDLDPLFGVGQGNGAGPAIWTVISSIFFDVLKSHGFGAILTAPFSKDINKIEGFGFVDDTDILQTGLNYEDYMDISDKLQAAVELWQKCTEVSGGCLVPAKSWWTLIDFTWDKGRWKYVSEFEEAELKIKDIVGRNTQLNLLKPSEGQKMLGVWLSPDGSNDKQIEVMRGITTSWAEKARTGYMSKTDAWQAITMTVMKKLEYPLIALTLTEQECNKIMAPALAIGLGKAGICQKISRKVLYGTRELQGMGLHNLFTTMGICQIQALLNHTWEKTLTGNLLMTSLESLKLEIGITGSVFTRSHDLFGHLATDSWIANLWKFCWTNKITIEDKCAEVDVLRVRDRMLNEWFAETRKSGIITNNDWKRANICRIYLQIMSLGEITTGDGKWITTGIWEGKRKEENIHDIDWPEQGEPSAVDWAAWRRVLTATFCSGEDIRLTVPLGMWLNNTNVTIKQWKWYWDYRDKILYKRHGQGFLKYNQVDEGRRTRLSQNGFSGYTWVPADPIKERLERTTVTEANDSIYPEGSSPILRCDTNQYEAQPVNIGERLKRDLNNLKGNKWAAKQVTTTPSIDNIMQDLEKGTLVGVSDGSYKEGIGTASYIIENLSGTERIIGLIEVPGHEDEQDSYRSELAGLYGIVLVLELLESYSTNIKGHIVIACDGKGALHKAFDTQFKASTKLPHFDILGGIHNMRNKIKCIMLPVHVKGHQDEQPQKDINRLGILNIECDLRAKLYWRDIQPSYRRSTFDIPGSFWKLRVCNLLVGTNSTSYLRMSIEGAKLLDYWVGRNKRFPQEQLEQIDIQGLNKASKTISWERQRWISKFLSGWCATNSKMLKWKKRLVESCPRCGHEHEDTKHILNCKSQDVLILWKKELNKLNLWLVYVETCPQLRRAIIEGLTVWKMGPSHTKRENYTYTGVKAAIVSQNRLGWWRFVEGTISKKWRNIQQHYYTSMSIPKTSDAWVARLIVKMWDIIFVIWQHRNSCLHNTPLAEIMGGSYALENSLRNEWNLGFDTLPSIVSATLPQSIERLMEGSTIERKGWFVMIRRARESQPNYEPLDEFSEPGHSLRKWAGF